MNKYTSCLILILLFLAGYLSDVDDNPIIVDDYSPTMKKIRAHCMKFYAHESDSPECVGPVCGRNVNNHSLIKFETNCTFDGYICLHITLYEPVVLEKCKIKKGIPYISKHFRKNIHVEVKPLQRRKNAKKESKLSKFYKMLKGLEVDLDVSL